MLDVPFLLAESLAQFMPGGAASDLAAVSSSNRTAALRVCLERLAACRELGTLGEALTQCLAMHFHMERVMLLRLDGTGQRLYPVGSHGYTESEGCAELRRDAGVSGSAAQQCRPLHIGPMARHAHSATTAGEPPPRRPGRTRQEDALPRPALAEPRHQLALSLVWHGTLLGVLYLERPWQLPFSCEDENALMALAHYLAQAIALHTAGGDEPGATTPGAAPAVIRHHPLDHSIFVNDDYLIKGVAGAIFWKLLCEHQERQRRDFCNRELRLDASLGLPQLIENLEARLILLQRRLAQRCPFVAIEKTGRGRFRLRVERPLRLSEA